MAFYDSINEKMNSKELEEYFEYLQHSLKDADLIAKSILKNGTWRRKPRR